MENSDLVDRLIDSFRANLGYDNGSKELSNAFEEGAVWSNEWASIYTKNMHIYLIEYADYSSGHRITTTHYRVRE